MVNSRPQKVTVLIVGAGNGTRFGSELPKQFVNLCGMPVFLHAVRAFSRALPEARVVLVFSLWGKQWWEQYCTSAPCPESTLPVVIGGDSRTASVMNGLKYLHDCCSDFDDSIVMIHDAARPLIAPHVINNVLSVITDGADGALPAALITDSMVRLDNGGFESVPRSEYLTVQTPQTFRACALWKAYEAAINSAGTFTDDLSVFRASYPAADIKLVVSDIPNIKITRPDDLAIAETILRVHSSCSR